MNSSKTKKYILDNRTEETARQNFIKGKKAEKIIMTALVDYFSIRGFDCWFEEINENESWLDNKVHNDPDYYFSKNGKLFTVEVKVSFTGRFHGGEIYVRPHPFLTSQKRPNPYPNFITLVATSNRFAIIPASKFTKDRFQVAKKWSNNDVKKKVFVFSEDEQKWFFWDYPLVF